MFLQRFRLMTEIQIRNPKATSLNKLSGNHKSRALFSAILIYQLEADQDGETATAGQCNRFFIYFVICTIVVTSVFIVGVKGAAFSHFHVYNILNIFFLWL